MQPGGAGAVEAESAQQDHALQGVFRLGQAGARKVVVNEVLGGESTRDEESAVRGPRIYAVAALPPHAEDVIAVEHLEGQPEAGVELVAPLEQHRRRAGDDDLSHLLAQEQFAGDEAGLDGLAEADVVGDEEVDARQQEGLAERFKPVGVEANAGAERGLEEARVGGGDAVPAQGVQVGREQPGRVEAAAGDAVPAGIAEDAGIDLHLPKRLERLALGVVVEAGHANERTVHRRGRRGNVLDEVLALADANDLPGLGPRTGRAHRKSSRAALAIGGRSGARTTMPAPGMEGQRVMNFGEGRGRQR